MKHGPERRSEGPESKDSEPAPDLIRGGRAERVASRTEPDANQVNAATGAQLQNTFLSP
jgi:hypothetical protein